MTKALRYIVIEGPIGVGKTSLAKKLATDLDSDLLLEQADENPFLANFYQQVMRIRFSLKSDITRSANLGFDIVCQELQIDITGTVEVEFYVVHFKDAHSKNVTASVEVDLFQLINANVEDQLLIGVEALSVVND